MKQILRNLPLSVLCVVCGGMLVPVSAYADEEIDVHAPYVKVKKAMETNDRDLFVSALRFPLTMCFTGTPVRYTQPSDLDAFSLELIMGGQNVINAFVRDNRDRRTGEPYEVAFDNEQVFGVFANSSDSEWLSMSYTSKGVYDPNPQSPIPNPQSPSPIPKIFYLLKQKNY